MFISCQKKSTLFRRKKLNYRWKLLYSRAERKIFFHPSSINTDKCVDYVCKYADKSEGKIMYENLMVIALSSCNKGRRLPPSRGSMKFVRGRGSDSSGQYYPQIWLRDPFLCGRGRVTRHFYPPSGCHSGEEIVGNRNCKINVERSWNVNLK